MEELVVVNVCLLGGKDPLQNVLQVPNDIKWQDFELLLKLTFEREEIEVKYLDEDNEEVCINSNEELVEAFKVAAKQHNSLHLNITPMKSPPESGTGENTEDIIDIEVRNQTVSVTNTKPQETPEPTEEEVVVMETINERVEATHEEESTSDKDDSYIIPTTDDCVIIEDGDSATVVVEDLEELKEPEASASTSDGVSKNAVDSTEEKINKEFFRLRSQSHNLVLDVDGCGTRPGTRLILWEAKSLSDYFHNQVFYEDKSRGTICSLSNNMCIDANEHRAVVMPFSAGKASQQWMIQEDRIQHRLNSDCVISVNAPLHLTARQFSNGFDQRWIIEYIDVEAKEVLGPVVSFPHLEVDLDTKFLMSGARPKKARKLEKKLRKHYYSYLSHEFSRLQAQERMEDRQKEQETKEEKAADEEEIVCLESGETSRRLPSSSDQPPEWFYRWMDKFKNDMAKDISQMVARHSVQQILAGLEGAVITSVPGTSGLGPTLPQRPQHGRHDSMDSDASSGTVYCHAGVVCDHCDRTIVGIRYKCGNCEDYDLCEECEVVDGAHDPEHVFLKIRRPTLTAGRKLNGKMMPLLKRSVYVTPEEIQKRFEEKTARKEKEKQEPKEVKKDRKEESNAKRAAEKLAEKANKIAARFQKYEEKLVKKQEEKSKKQERKENKANQKREDKEEHSRRKEERLKRRGETQKSQKEAPTKRGKLDLPQFRLIERMDAAFVEDVTFPDGSHIQPGTKFVKRWLLRNIGTHAWTTSTKLKHLWGGMEPVSTDVGVPSLEPGGEGVISVQIIAPQQPGVYQSHWRLSHHGLYFGHRVWCHIIVDEKEVLEHSDQEKESVLTVQREDYEEVKGNEGEPSVAIEDVDGECEIVKVEDACERPAEDGSTSDGEKKPTSDSGAWPDNGMTEQDIEMFEMLDIRDRNVPKVSQTATPNNTPLVTSPPKSPTLDLDIEVIRTISSSSSVEVVSDVSPTSSTDEVTQRMTELVQERIASLGLKPDIDVQSISSYTDSDGDDSDSDFYIVPLPDCFNPELPCSTSTSTSVVIKKEDAKKSVDELFTTSHEIPTQPLTPTSTDAKPEVIDGEPEVIDLTQSDIQDDVSTEVSEEIIETREGVVEENQPEPLSAVGGDVGGETATVVRDENGNNSECTTPDDEEKDVSEDDDKKRKGREGSPSAGAMASNITVAALGVLSQAAVSAFTLTKDVFHTLQAQHNFVPPKSNWKPKEQQYAPPKSVWTPPEQTVPASVTNEDYTPPKEAWTSAEQTVSSVPKPLTPEEQLIEMGFANRELNERLLKECNNDLQKVVQELINMGDQDWHESRH